MGVRASADIKLPHCYERNKRNRRLITPSPPLIPDPLLGRLSREYGRRAAAGRDGRRELVHRTGSLRAAPTEHGVGVCVAHPFHLPFTVCRRSPPNNINIELLSGWPIGAGQSGWPNRRSRGSEGAPSPHIFSSSRRRETHVRSRDLREGRVLSAEEAKKNTHRHTTKV